MCTHKSRIIGFDIARALAIFGMVIVNFKIAMQAQAGTDFWLGFAQLFEGRASALFVILAGVGISLMTAKIRHTPDQQDLRSTYMQLLKRAAALFIIGLIFTPIWPADILHFYGVYFAIAAALCFCSDRTLLLSSIGFVLGFVGLLFVFDYNQGWDWPTLTYTDLWTWQGMVRHLMFNGFHPVFPWTAFLLFGMWLGRQPLNQSHTQKRLFITALCCLMIIEGSLSLLHYFASTYWLWPNELTDLLFTSSIIPPLPQYVLSAASSAILILVGCLWLSQRYQQSQIMRSLYKTGQLSLTLYLGHVVIGMGLLESLNLLNSQPIEVALFSALVCCLCAIAFSVIWLHFFKHGPCEWLFKKLTH